MELGLSGQSIARYELVRKIAAGGMAEVFLARQWGEGGFFRDVVVKRLFPHLAEHDSVLQKFQYEAQLLAHLNHPNIPQVIELGYADGTWFMTMEYVEGYDIADVWRAGARLGQPMPLPVSIGIGMQVCEALHHAHERKDKAGNPLRIVHRDVTPQNVMLTRDGVVKLMDFGVAKTAARTDTEAGALKGTLSYMSPEQVRGRALDRRSDVFSIGVILYELTTGQRLFRGSEVEVMTAIVEHDVPPPTHLFPDYPPDLETIVMSALARQRKDRISSAAHLTRALEQLAMRHGVLVGPRTVARYVSRVLPAERVMERDLGIVQTPSPEHVAPSSDPPAIEVEVELPTEPPMDSPFEDLSRTSPDGPVPFGLAELGLDPFEAGAEPLSFGDADAEDGIDALFETDDEESGTTPLAGFDEASGDRPVVLLQPQNKKKTIREDNPDGEFLRSLQRRLEENDDGGG